MYLNGITVMKQLYTCIIIFVCSNVFETGPDSETILRHFSDSRQSYNNS